MGSRLYVRASSNTIRTVTGEDFNSVAHTQVAIATMVSVPGAGNYHAVIGMPSGTAARELALELNGDTGPGTLGAKVGATRIVPSTNMIPSTDGRWYLFGATKAAGTVAVDFFAYDYLTGTWAEFASSGTVANRNAAIVTSSIGSRGAADYWDGRIGAVMTLPFELTKGQWRTLAHGRAAWRDWFNRPMQRAGDDTTLDWQGYFVDLTVPWRASGVMDYGLNTRVYGTGTQPTFDAVATPPGW